MRTFITSDTHFGHANIIRYCARPFSDAAEMDAEMIARWNATVARDDLVWHLGDFCMGREKAVANYLSKLNGRINLVLGNHDRFSQRKYIDLGFNKVYDRPVVLNDFFVLSHRPVQFITDAMPFANLYGHVHNQERCLTFTANTACLCVERWNYTPVPLDDVIARLTHQPPSSS